MNPVIVTDADTHGTSPKARLAAVLTSTLGTIAAALIAWLVVGVELDRAALGGALTGATLALIAYAGAWLGSTGQVRIPNRAIEASDQLNAGRLEPPA